MNYKKTTIIFFLTLFAGIKLFSQNNIESYTSVVPPSPTAASLGTYGQVPVGMFTGTAQFDIPIYQLNSKKLSVPISLNYSTNGIKVDQIASWVGMGWSLNAGGVITRTIKDKEDNKGTRLQLKNKDTNEDLDSNLLNGFLFDGSKVDLEPDIYSFNFNGQSGKFIIDIDGFPRLIPHQDLEIQIIKDTQNYFVITTKDGTKYYFGELDENGGSNSVEWTMIQNNGCLDGRPISSWFNTAWYLTRIVHPTGDTIKFKYISSTLSYDSGITQNHTTSKQNYSCPECNNYDSSETCISKLSVKSSRLSEISSDNILVTFNSSTRQGGGATTNFQYKLDSIAVSDKINVNNINQFNFTYKYTNHTDKRLFLDKLIEIGSDISSPKEYSFDYNNYNSLPERLSFSQDHWGYYNGAINGNRFLHIPVAYADKFPNYIGANREPDANFSIYGSLNKITYPTGGTSEIDYEAQSYWDNSQGINVETGGVRVKRITSKENSASLAKIERYYYGTMNDIERSSGTIPRTPNYYYQSFNLVDCNTEPVGSTPHMVIPELCPLDNLTSNSSNYNYNNGSSHIVYSSVIKSYGENFENGGEYFKYLASADSPGRIKMGGSFESAYSNNSWNSGTLKQHQIFKKNTSGVFVTLNNTSYNYNYEYEGANNNDERNSDTFTAAVIRKRETDIITALNYLRPAYNCTATDVLSQISLGWRCLTNHVHIWTLTNSSGYRKCISPFNNGPNNVEIFQDHKCFNKTEGDPYLYEYDKIGSYDVTYYDILTRWFYLKNKTTTQYDDDGLNPVVTTIDYEYDNALHSQISKTTTTNSKGDNIVQSTYYPLDYDYTNLTEFQPLVQNYIHGVPVDIRQEVNGKLTSGQLLKYNDKGQVTELYQADNELGTILALDSLNPYSYGQRRLSINYDATTNNIQDFNKEKGITSVYLWSYNNNYPVAKIQNATIAEVSTAMNTVSSTFIDDLGLMTNRDSIAGSLVQLRTEMASSGPSDAMVSTYVYDPVKGVIMQTATNGLTTHYQYDDLGRMKAILNNDEDVIQYIDYNYQSDPLITLSTSSYNFTNSSGSTSVSVTSNRPWTVSESVSWLSIAGGSGSNNGSFTINSTTNTGSARSTTVTVTTVDNTTRTISVSQDQAFIYDFSLIGNRNSLKTNYYYNSTISSQEESIVDEYYGLETGDDGLQIRATISNNDNSSPDPVTFTVEYDNNAYGWINPSYFPQDITFDTNDPGNNSFNYGSINVTSKGVTKIISVRFDSY